MKAINSILTVVIAVLLPVGAFAITERDLAGPFTTNQAEALWDLNEQGVSGDLAVGGDAITFAAAGTIATTGSGTDLTLAPIDTIILKGANDDQRIITYSATSDTFLSWLYGDSATSGQAFAIYSNTTTSTDSDSLALSGGGDLLATRGAFLHLKGADASGAGDFTASAADTSGSTMSFTAPAADGTITLTTVATQALRIDASQNTYLGAAPAVDPVGAKLHVFGDSDVLSHARFLQSTATATGVSMDFYKTRATDGGANTIVQSGDDLGYLYFYGADGVTWRRAARIMAEVDGTPGSGDMPGRLVFQTSTDGTETLTTALTLSNAQAATFTGTITSTATGSAGWTAAASVAACNTTCTSACAFGFDAGTNALVSCDNADADTCVCLGAS